MKPNLVILAAGMGSRYGGMKQLEAVGPGGATIMDYSIFDALRAGFGKVTFVIRTEMEEAFHAAIGSRYASRVEIAYAFQRLDGLPSGFSVPTDRTKPWGTGQAVLAARECVAEPFAVINADDFYGADAYVRLVEFLRQEDSGDGPTYAMVGYRLRDTLSDAGEVNRGVCQCGGDGRLSRITEITGIRASGDGGVYVDEGGAEQVIGGDERVSMNAWGFTPVFLKQLRERFEMFLREQATSMTAEFYLPAAIQDLMEAGRAQVEVLPTEDRWVGVTYPQDKAYVVATIDSLVASGRYPRQLWA